VDELAHRAGDLLTGWPAEVPRHSGAGKRRPGLRRTGCAPGAEEWEIMATAWLLDLIPGYRRSELVPPHVIDEALRDGRG
jgi:hypothetical protein